MKPILVQEAVIAEHSGYAEKVLDSVSYQEALDFCRSHDWKCILYGRTCSLRIVREDYSFEEFPLVMKQL